MIIKINFVCLLGLNVCTIQYLIVGAYANSLEIKKVNNSHLLNLLKKLEK